jgi:hypothetical protein
MTYLVAWLSLIGPNELAALSVFAVVVVLADRAILWFDKRQPWPGFINLRR